MNRDAPTELVLPLMLCCPHCWQGGSHLYENTLGLTEWAEVECPSCGKAFEIAEAIDELFAKGQYDGYRLWAGSHMSSHMVECPKGQTVLLNVRGAFDRVYEILWATSSGEWLAGGISVRYLPQGDLMVAVARGRTELPTATLSLVVTAIGDKPGAPPLQPWRELMLEAVVSSTKSRRLAPILGVAAVDLFIEKLLGRDVGGGRPSSWHLYAEELTGQKLGDMQGVSYRELEKAVGIRNDFAHGREPRLRDELAVREAAWEERTGGVPSLGIVAPSSVFCLRRCLAAVRALRRKLRHEPRIVGPDGLQSGQRPHAQGG